MTFRSVELPGVGTKYELTTEKGDKIVIIFMSSGNIQIYVLEKGCETPAVAELNPGEARRLGSILTGAILEAEREAVEIAFSALSDLRISIHTYIIGKNVVGRSIGELGIRKKTGVTIVAVSRMGRNIINPPPSFIFEEGDVVVAIGEHEQLKAFESKILRM
jgi:TrkA domain protein